VVLTMYSDSHYFTDVLVSFLFYCVLLYIVYCIISVLIYCIISDLINSFVSNSIYSCFFFFEQAKMELDYHKWFIPHKACKRESLKRYNVISSVTITGRKAKITRLQQNTHTRHRVLPVASNIAYIKSGFESRTCYLFRKC